MIVKRDSNGFPTALPTSEAGSPHETSLVRGFEKTVLNRSNGETQKPSWTQRVATAFKAKPFSF